jgi:hypothetical protein
MSSQNAPIGSAAGRTAAICARRIFMWSLYRGQRRIGLVREDFDLV